MDTKGLQKEFISWCKANKKSPKSEDETKLLFVAFMKEKHPEEYKQAVQNQLKQQQAQVKKALHGIKLNYFKSLKNQCAEDEEIVYYKKGGSVTCGCKKKDGGEIPQAKEGSVIEKFKARKMQEAGKMIKRPEKQLNKPADKSQQEYEKGTADHTKPGEKKKIPAKCGGSSIIAQFKKHHQGGKIQFSF